MKAKLNYLANAIVIAGLQSATTQAFQIEEVVVTATKRAQSTMDVPYNISATTSETLERQGITDFSKLADSVPGLAYTDTGSRDSGINSGLIIRGLNTSSSGFTDFATVAAPTVSVYVGETPLFYNVYLKDIERVEVLRGPQGTLYGSGSLGGTIRYINKEPDTEQSYVEMHSRISHTGESSGINSDSFAVINAALNDDMALRAVVGYVDNQGFIDAARLRVFDDNNQPVGIDPGDVNSQPLESHKSGSNGEMIKHARLTYLWDISDTLSLLVSHQQQEDSIDDRQVSNNEHPDGGDHTHLQRIREGADRELSLTNIEVEADLGFATLTSATSMFESESELIGDQSAAYYNEGYWAGFYYNGFPREAVIGEYFKDVETISQEFRLTSNSDGDLNWILGAFYLKQEVEALNNDYHRGFYQWATDTDHYYAPQVATLAALGQPTDLFYSLNQKVENIDKAIFGELTYQITEQWQVTVGARFFEQEFSNDTVNRSPLCGAWCSDDGVDALGIYGASQENTINDRIFKFNTSYDITPDIMLYTTLAQGFRNGGANGIPTAGPWAEPAELVPYTNDTALSFEIGAKGSAFDNRVQFSAAAFQIDWDDVILTTASVNGFTILTNGDTAQSRGVEMESTVHFTENLQGTFGYAYTDAKLTGDFTTSGIVGFDGDKLPGVPDHMVTASLTYSHMLRGSELVFNLNGSWVDEVTTDINDSNNNFTVVDGYSVLNASVFWEVSDNFSVSLFADNLTDELAPTNTRGPKYARQDSTQRDIYSYIMRPRTIGLGLKYSFE
ncbi:TonB-dependent receptor [Pseudomaricurvus alkylphenolicus]|uniref:TonB-dependent receptor n=1 Tax=Pseudomaricurvus alkylphenolicus TaxID=1306991 RepID=UPI00142275CA|nr:TonB-dependent receptor [Pseudomaricurvus alkylphenolicus]NIB38313.1 TonB-dependent receptor [Pseudomaricurvus alkylphenolicus]